jgi:hypothetical protein
MELGTKWTINKGGVKMSYMLVSKTFHKKTKEIGELYFKRMNLPKSKADNNRFPENISLVSENYTKQD